MEKERYIKAYTGACEYLKTMTPQSVDLDKYFYPSDDFTTMDEVFYRFIFSAQNYQRMPNVIKLKERSDEIKDILGSYDINAVKKMDSDVLYMSFIKKFEIKTKDSPMNSWRKWTNAVIDSAKFLSEFKDVDDFRGFVKLFDYNVHTSMALPLLISHRIKGIGFALACDLLKELGFTRYPKPDVHIIEVFSALGLSSENPGDVFEAVVRMAEYCKDIEPDVTPYKVDKVFWLICSGKFYKEQPELNINSRKKEYISWAKEKFVNND